MFIRGDLSDIIPVQMKRGTLYGLHGNCGGGD
jgi:hypothetical protein